MLRLVLIIALLVPLLITAQVDYVKKNDEPKQKINNEAPKEFNRKISIHAFVGGSGSGNKFAPTGYQYINGKDISVRTNGGFCTGLKVSYTLSNKIELELGYEYQVSALRNEVEGGSGSFKRHITSPTVKYKLPIIPEELAVYFYGGANLIIGSRIEVDIEFPSGHDGIEYIYNPSLGLLIGTELEFYTDRLISLRFGLNHNVNHIKINRAYHNDQRLDNSLVHPDAAKFHSNSAFIYLGAALNLNWKQKLK